MEVHEGLSLATFHEEGALESRQKRFLLMDGERVETVRICIGVLGWWRGSVSTGHGKVHIGGEELRCAFGLSEEFEHLLFAINFVLADIASILKLKQECTG